MNGIALLQHVRAAYPALAVIMVTGIRVHQHRQWKPCGWARMTT